MIGALAAIVVYFAVDDRKVFIYVCGFALFFKIMEYIIRFIHR